MVVNKWGAGVLRMMVENKLYTGQYDYVGTQATIEEYRIIDDATFKEANELLIRYDTSGSTRDWMEDERKEA